MGFWLSSQGHQDHAPSSVAWSDIIDECSKHGYFSDKIYDDLLSADGGKVSKTLAKKITRAAKTVRQEQDCCSADYLTRFDKTIQWLEQVQEDGFVVS